MAERLREISHLTLCVSIVLLREQPDIVPKRQQAIKHRARLGDAALQDQIVDEPEAASEERAFSER